jgi:hypothetical protein
MSFRNAGVRSLGRDGSSREEDGMGEDRPNASLRWSPRLRRPLLGAALSVIAAVSSALMASPVAAVPPEREEFQTEPSSGVLAVCDGFEVINASEGAMVTLHKFFDQDGDLIRVSFHSRIEDTYTNSVTGRSISGSGQFNGQVVLEEPFERQAGIQYHVVVPGAGVVLIDAGRLVFDALGDLVFQGGRHQVWDGDVAALCAALT